MSSRLTSPPVWNPDEPAITNAHAVLPQMTREYFARGRKVVFHETPASKLHPFRLDTKRFRYTLEVFRDLYGHPLEEFLALLKPVQDALGEANDCVATRASFPAGKPFKDFLKKRAAKKAAEFRAAWREGFDAPGNEERWLEFLSRSAFTTM